MPWRQAQISFKSTPCQGDRTTMRSQEQTRSRATPATAHESDEMSSVRSFTTKASVFHPSHQWAICAEPSTTTNTKRSSTTVHVVDTIVLWVVDPTISDDNRKFVRGIHCMSTQYCLWETLFPYLLIDPTHVASRQQRAHTHTHKRTGFLYVPIAT